MPVTPTSPPPSIPQVRCEGIGRHTVMGTTIDDSMGEAFDKTARLLGISAVPGDRMWWLGGGGGRPGGGGCNCQGGGLRMLIPSIYCPAFLFCQCACVTALSCLAAAAADTAAAGVPCQVVPTWSVWQPRPTLRMWQGTRAGSHYP
jgi:hypothetical protein